MALMCSLEYSFILENPGSSCILLHPRLEWFLSWLVHYGMPAFQRSISPFCFRLLWLHKINFPQLWRVLDLIQSGGLVTLSNSKSHMSNTTIPPAKAYKVSFWMRSFQAKSMKRTMLITNNKAFVRLGIEAVKPQRGGCVPTTKRYRDRQGKRRYAGTSELKKSQNLVS